MKSPFKFLDAYEAKDKDVFFGRSDEIERLYQMVFKSRLLLVYGRSGTGKTSLVQCGLGSRFDITDWYPINIRRNQDINDSLKSALAKPREGILYNESIADTINWLYKNYLRPVYLIFDQFEELFVLGSKEEQDIFYKHIKDILDQNLACKILIIIREEFIADLSAFEQMVPSLFDFRLRIEPMNIKQVEEVIQESFKRFQIFPEHPHPDKKISDASLRSMQYDEVLERFEDNQLDEQYAKTSKEIIKKVGKGKTGIQLPYLQVYLDMFYRTDFKRTYGKEFDNKLAPLTFELKEIVALGDIDKVLGKFLEEQADLLQNNLPKKFPKSPIPSKVARRILNVFVSSKGTKRPLRYEEDGNIKLLDNTQSLPKDLNAKPEMLSFALKELREARLLRFSGKDIELAHDSLAEIIYKDPELREINIAEERIQNAYDDHQKERGDFLDAKQILAYEDTIPLLDLKEEVLAFVEKSKEASKAKIRKSKLLQRIAFTVIGVALLASGFAWSFFMEKENLTSSNEELKSLYSKIMTQQISITELTLETVDFNISLGEYPTAIDLLNKLDREVIDSMENILNDPELRQIGLSMEKDQKTVDSLNQKVNSKNVLTNTIKELMENAAQNADTDSFHINYYAPWKQAIQNYNQALITYNKDPDLRTKVGQNYIDIQKENLKSKIQAERNLLNSIVVYSRKKGESRKKIRELNGLLKQ